MNVRACALAFLLGLPVCLSAQAGGRQWGEPIRGGAFEASGVVGVPGSSGVLFVDDSSPRHVFWLELGAKGAQKGQAEPVAIGVPVTDLEDITSDGTWFYAVGSQSKGNTRAGYGLVRFAFDPRTRKVSNAAGIADLTGILQRKVPELAAGARRGAGNLNIEGLAWDPSSARLLLGLREPTAETSALIVAMKLPTGRGTFDRALLENAEISVLRMPAGGLGIRGLGFDSTTRRLLVLTGPAADVSGRREPFRLLAWDLSASAAPANLASFPAELKPEGVTRVMNGGRQRTLVVCDSGRYLFLD